MNLMMIVHLKKSFESWKELFDNDPARSEFCDESKTMVGRVDDKTALLVLFDVDQVKMKSYLTSQLFADLVKDYVEKHDAYKLEELAPA